MTHDAVLTRLPADLAAARATNFAPTDAHPGIFIKWRSPEHAELVRTPSAERIVRPRLFIVAINGDPIWATEVPPIGPAVEVEEDVPFDLLNWDDEKAWLEVAGTGHRVSVAGRWRLALLCYWEGQTTPLVAELVFSWAPGSLPKEG